MNNKNKRFISKVIFLYILAKIDGENMNII